MGGAAPRSSPCGRRRHPLLTGPGLEDDSVGQELWTAMFENLSLLDLASAAARHAAARHRVIAENVANADTPGYRARDVEDFQATVNEAFTARTTRPGHLVFTGAPGVPRIIDAGLAPKPNGNTVSLEDQAVRATRAEERHALALAVYAKAVDLLRLGIGRVR